MTAPGAEKSCDLCNSTSFELLSRRDRKGRELLTGVCTGCGLVAHMQIPTEDQLDEFYAEHYRRRYHGETTPSTRRVMRAWKNGQRIYTQLAPLISRDDLLFEVGSGIGCTVKAFELHGHRVAGIEPNKGFCRYSIDQLRAPVENCSLFDLPREPAYDLVLLVHVIEHFRSPRKALQHIHAMIRPGGRLYVECPNLGAPFTTRSRLFHFAHIHNFTPTTLSMMARRCGFALQRQLSTVDDPNLQMLFGRDDSAELTIQPDSCRRTLDALDRYSALTYHLRVGYLRGWLAKRASFLAEYLSAKRFVRRIVRICNEQGADTGVGLRGAGAKLDPPMDDR